MKWLTEYFGAEAMFVSRCDLRRRLLADGVNLREAMDDLVQLHVFHSMFDRHLNHDSVQAVCT